MYNVLRASNQAYQKNTNDLCSLQLHCSDSRTCNTHPPMLVSIILPNIIFTSEFLLQRERNDTSSSRFVHTRDTVDDLEEGVKRSTLANQGNSEKIIPLNAIIR